jgi:yeast amino acid transporter
LVYDVLQQLLITCAAISWAIICATYLRFRLAVEARGIKNAIPPKALSSLQPYLAWYGLAWSLLFSSWPLVLSSLTIVMFNGYEVFTRGNSLWSIVTTSWGYYLSSWVELGVLVIMFFGWLLYGYRVHGQWGLRIPNLERANVVTDIAPLLEPPSVPKGWHRKFVSWVLNNI